MKRSKKNLTYRKADRAIVAIVELIECDDVTGTTVVRLDEACNLIRTLRDRALRP